LSPISTRKEHNPVDTLILALWDHYDTYDLENYKIKKKLCHFNPLKLLYFVIAGRENKYRY
jgi:hypothetical protein